jgi:hypothetical protein
VIVGNNAVLWPLKHSGLSGCMVYFGGCGVCWFHGSILGIDRSIH